MRSSGFFFLALLVVSRAAVAQDHAHPRSEKLGTVSFATSCNAAAQAEFTRAASLLHSFEFGPAIAGFEAVVKADPSCGIAAWGIALSRWGNPFAVGIRSPEQVRQGLAAVERARTIGAKTQRERAYIDAVAHLYVDGARQQQQRVEAYRDAMGQLSKQYPDDVDGALFYALSLTAAEDLNDKSYASRLQAVGILEPLYAKHPDHPGIAHYIIHSYDVPALASRALDAAKRYANIAPSAPHALHMPSHTFTRVGLWQESIETNIESAKAARQLGMTGEELHASDYQIYAYLQTAQDRAAKGLLDALPEIASRFNPATVGGAAPPAAAFYALAAIPARWTLERGAWTEAAKLQTKPSPLPYADALTEFARAIGAARAGDLAKARVAVDRLESLRQRMEQMNEAYWTQQIQIQRDGAAAWLAFAGENKADAIAKMRQVADAEDRTEKAAVTPGPLAPARELLGEMLLESKNMRGALTEFEASLTKDPNRFRSLLGAAKAASASGDGAKAKQYYTRLVEMCSRADAPRPELQAARAAVGR
ncbi:MAG TPA: hypothetical protein VM240_11615 [Verrucomicrobiae bacterium]|nr:hypothetical protein [Verrucomicrobiae bacterium]